MANNKSAAERARAYRVRRAIENGDEITDDDRNFIERYPASQNSSLQSASEKLIHIEERQAVDAQGPAAEAAAMAGFAREEGRRLDHLLGIAMTAMGRACDMYHRMATDMLAQQAATQAETQELLATIRDHYLGRIQAEGQAELMAQAAQLAASQSEMSPEALLMQVLAGAMSAKQKATESKPADPPPAAK